MYKRQVVTEPEKPSNPENSKKTGVVTASKGLNVRKESNTSSQIIGILNSGERDVYKRQLISGIYNRNMAVWWNYPVTDYFKGKLALGPGSSITYN